MHFKFATKLNFNEGNLKKITIHYYANRVTLKNMFISLNSRLDFHSEIDQQIYKLNCA
jgi:hypothetical protein